MERAGTAGDSPWRRSRLTDIPAWIGAIGTVGTLSTGLILFANTISDRRREYAKLVAAWTDFGKLDEDSIRTTNVENLSLGNAIDSGSGAQISAVRIEKVEDGGGIGGILGSSEGEPFGFRLNLRNNGMQPIYGCELLAYMDKKVLPTGRYPVLFDKLEVELGIVAPGIEISYPLLIGAPKDEAHFAEALVKALTFRLQFTDAAGRRWVRDESGELRRLCRSAKSSSVQRRPTTISAGPYADVQQVVQEDNVRVGNVTIGNVTVRANLSTKSIPQPNDDQTQRKQPPKLR
jgi:hypothetical protein